MVDQPNMDPWNYYENNRAKEYLEFAYSHNAPHPMARVQHTQSHVDIDSSKFIEYILKNKSTCQEKWFHPRDILSPESNIEMAFPLTVGLHQGNTYEYNWGLYGETREQLLNLIGSDNLTAMGFIPETVYPRLIVYMPGHGIPWHRDTMDAWKNKFPKLVDKTVARQLLMVSEWHWGHILQIDNDIISHWSSGDVFMIPVKHWHLSANQGVVPKMTVSLTGLLK